MHMIINAQVNIRIIMDILDHMKIQYIKTFTLEVLVKPHHK